MPTPVHAKKESYSVKPHGTRSRDFTVAIRHELHDEVMQVCTEDGNLSVNQAIALWIVARKAEQAEQVLKNPAI